MSVPKLAINAVECLNPSISELQKAISCLATKPIVLEHLFKSIQEVNSAEQSIPGR